eukprot:UN17894
MDPERKRPSTPNHQRHHRALLKVRTIIAEILSSVPPPRFP